jgi:hypothetical protein
MIFAIAVLLAAYALIGPRKMFWSLHVTGIGTVDPPRG